MKTIKTFAGMLLAMAAIACSKNDSGTADDTDLYAGQWQGNVTGEDQGILSFYVYDDGSVTGDFFTNGTQNPIPLNGNVKPTGALTATFSTASISGSISGNLSEKSGSGTWIITSSQTSGTWSGTKN